MKPSRFASGKPDAKLLDISTTCIKSRQSGSKKSCSPDSCGFAAKVPNLLFEMIGPEFGGPWRVLHGDSTHLCPFLQAAGYDIAYRAKFVHKAALNVDIRNLITHNRGVVNQFFFQRRTILRRSAHKSFSRIAGSMPRFSEPSFTASGSWTCVPSRNST